MWRYYILSAPAADASCKNGTRLPHETWCLFL